MVTSVYVLLSIRAVGFLKCVFDLNKMHCKYLYTFVFIYFFMNRLLFATGFMLYSVWAWHVICSPDAFSWNFGFVFLNLAQVVYLVYEMRPVKFDPELEEVYHTLFEPFKVSIRFQLYSNIILSKKYNLQLIHIQNTLYQFLLYVGLGDGHTFVEG